MKPFVNLQELQPIAIKVAARSSKLSRAQVEEVRKALVESGIPVQFEPIFIKSQGDLDRTTSLKEMEKSDFFTKEIDELLLNDTAQIAIHSAKDLPETLHPDLHIIAITEGVDPSDSLVLEEPYSILTLPKFSKIGTSSLRREENLKAIRPDFSFIDIRGTIEERLDLLHRKKIDALVVAEAAILRLGLTHLHREKIIGPVAENQGRLAVVAKRKHRFLEELFASLDTKINL